MEQDEVCDDRMKVVLMVGYAYPPAGYFMGYLRLVKFVKYLPRFGWRPIVFSAGGGFCLASAAEDFDLPSATVVRTYDPLGVLARVTGIAGAKNAYDSYAVRLPRSPGTPPQASGSSRLQPSTMGRIGAFLSRQKLHAKRLGFRLLKEVLIPDYNITWYPFAVLQGRQILRSHKVDVIYSTSPTVTNHLVAARLAHRFHVPWVADFRDPWTTGPIYQHGRWRHRLDRMIERRILREATKVITVSEGCKSQLLKVYPQAAHKISIIPNGFDGADLLGIKPARQDGRFMLTYCGEFYGGERNPEGLFRALTDLKSRGHIHHGNFALTIVGRTEPDITRKVAGYEIGDLVHFTDYLPHREALARVAEASVALVITMTDERSRGEMTTKFYEYLGLRRPILALTRPDFELARVVRELGVGTAIHVDDSEGIAAWLLEQVRQMEQNGFPPDLAEAKVSGFSREALASRLAGCLDELVDQTKRAEQE